MDRTAVRRIVARISEALASEPPPENADVKALEGAAPWLRLRVGEYRVLYRPLTAVELAPLVAHLDGHDRPVEGYLVGRIVPRQGLIRAIDSLG